MEGKGVKKIVEAALIAGMLVALFAAEMHSSMAATTVDDDGNQHQQCIQECAQACPKNENCDLSCPLHCAVRQAPSPLAYDDYKLHSHCNRLCSVAPHCIRFNHDKNRRRRCIAECGSNCLANLKGSDF